MILQNFFFTRLLIFLLWIKLARTQKKLAHSVFFIFFGFTNIRFLDSVLLQLSLEATLEYHAQK